MWIAFYPINPSGYWKYREFWSDKYFDNHFAQFDFDNDPKFFFYEIEDLVILKSDKYTCKILYYWPCLEFYTSPGYFEYKAELNDSFKHYSLILLLNSITLWFYYYGKDTGNQH